MSSHAKLSPSSSSRWMSCPASVDMCKDIPNETNKWAEVGSAAHELLEVCIKNNEWAEKYLGHKFKDFENVEINGEITTCVNKALTYIRKIDSSNIKAEKKYYFTDLGLSDYGFQYGSCDVTVIKENMLGMMESIEIIDYKHGTSPVDPIENSQMMIYALGVVLDILKKDILIRDHKIEIQNNILKYLDLKLTIIQPREFNPKGDFIKTWDTTITDLINWYNKELVPAIFSTRNDIDVFNPNESNCHWCPAKTVCKAYASHITSGSIEDFSDINISSDKLTKNQLVNLVRNKTKILKLIEDIEKKLIKDIKSGSETYKDYFEIKKKLGNRRFNDSITKNPSYNELSKHLSMEEILTWKVNSVTKIEELLTLKFDRKTAKEILESVTNRPEGNYELINL